MTREEFLQTFPDLTINYQPSPAATAHIGDLTLFMTIGPSGAGKTSIMKQLGVPYVPSDTTRPKRPEEIEGVDFHFRTDYDRVIQQIKAGEFVQVAIGPGGDFYSTLSTSYPQSGTAVMAVMADVVPNFRDLGFKQTISAFIAPQSYEELLRRMKSHELAGDQIVRRLAEARRSLIFALNDHEMHFIMNDELDKAIAQAKDLVNGMVDTAREEQARQAAEQMLRGINL